MSSVSLKVIGHSPDKQRVAVKVSRNGKAGKYLVVKGMNTVVWMKPKGRSYVITADKCNCPASRGQCKHVIGTVQLKQQGFLKEEEWVKPTTTKVDTRKFVVVDRASPNFPDLPAGVAVGVGWYAERSRTVAVVPAAYSPPRGWMTSSLPDVVAFGRRCAPHIPPESING